MKIRNRWIYNKWIADKYVKFVAAIATAFSIVIIYVPKDHQMDALWCGLGILFIIYIAVVIWANHKKQVAIKIGETKVLIKQGDLFTETGKKIIPANEYFEVETDQEVIDPNCLHGQDWRSHIKISRESLYQDIVNALKGKNPSVVDQKREYGKQIRYRLGTIYDDHNDFFLLAYSRFDSDNRAYLRNEDIADCYLNMWNEIDIHRGSNSIVLPVLGASGIVRFRKTYTPQQLIELIMWSFRISGIRLNKTATLTIVVHESFVNEIDFLKFSYYSD